MVLSSVVVGPVRSAISGSGRFSFEVYQGFWVLWEKTSDLVNIGRNPGAIPLLSGRSRVLGQSGAPNTPQSEPKSTFALEAREALIFAPHSLSLRGGFDFKSLVFRDLDYTHLFFSDFAMPYIGPLGCIVKYAVVYEPMHFPIDLAFSYACNIIPSHNTSYTTKGGVRPSGLCDIVFISRIVSMMI